MSLERPFFFAQCRLKCASIGEGGKRKVEVWPESRGCGQQGRKYTCVASLCLVCVWEARGGRGSETVDDSFV